MVPFTAIPTESGFQWIAGVQARDIAMDSAEHCRIQAEECRRLLALAQSEVEAKLLTNLSRSWVMIANQIERYVEFMNELSER